MAKFTIETGGFVIKDMSMGNYDGSLPFDRYLVNGKYNNRLQVVTVGYAKNNGMIKFRAGEHDHRNIYGKLSDFDNRKIDMLNAHSSEMSFSDVSYDIVVSCSREDYKDAWTGLFYGRKKIESADIYFMSYEDPGLVRYILRNYIHRVPSNTWARPIMLLPYSTYKKIKDTIEPEEKKYIVVYFPEKVRVKVGNAVANEIRIEYIALKSLLMSLRFTTVPAGYESRSGTLQYIRTQDFIVHEYEIDSPDQKLRDKLYDEKVNPVTRRNGKPPMFWGCYRVSGDLILVDLEYIRNSINRSIKLFDGAENDKFTQYVIHTHLSAIKKYLETEFRIEYQFIVTDKLVRHKLRSHSSEDTDWSIDIEAA